jgi:hypothetical protein
MKKYHDWCNTKYYNFKKCKNCNLVMEVYPATGCCMYYTTNVLKFLKDDFWNSYKNNQMDIYKIEWISCDENMIKEIIE